MLPDGAAAAASGASDLLFDVPASADVCAGGTCDGACEGPSDGPCDVGATLAFAGDPDFGALEGTGVGRGGKGEERGGTLGGGALRTLEGATEVAGAGGRGSTSGGLADCAARAARTDNGVTDARGIGVRLLRLLAGARSELGARDSRGTEGGGSDARALAGRDAAAGAPDAVGVLGREVATGGAGVTLDF